MKLEETEKKKRMKSLTFWMLTLGSIILGVIFVIIGFKTNTVPAIVIGNFMVAISTIIIVNKFALAPAAAYFQAKILPSIENNYERFVSWALNGIRPIALFAGMIVLFFGSIAFFRFNLPEVVFFPEGQPNYANVFVEFPTGTDIEFTNKEIRKVEQDVIAAMRVYGMGSGKNVESVLTNVGEGTSDPNSGQAGENKGKTPNKAKLTISFVQYELRTEVTHADGVTERFNTSKALNEIRDVVGQIPGAVVSVAKDPNGPPVGPPINIAISGEEFDVLFSLHDEVRSVINNALINEEVEGIEKIKSDLDQGKPELLFDIDRDASRTYGLSTAQVAGALRTALFGKEISSYNEGKDDYPIMLRLETDQRYDLEVLKNMLITFRDQSDGKTKQVPISAIAEVKYSSSLGSVRRVDLDRVVTLYSNVSEGGNANEIIQELKTIIADRVQIPEGYAVEFTGEQEEQAKSMAFLQTALMIAVFAIFLIIVTQFNSISAPLIILLSVVFSFIGVFLGIAVFGDKFVVIMTMIGIISLAGVVVNNAIVLMDFTQLTRDRMKQEKGIPVSSRLSRIEISKAIVFAGKTRLRPVLLTAITTVLGLIPLAVGINIDFSGLFTRLEPNFYVGGDNVVFWGALSWTVIYGLTFATFLTLVIVPVMILLFDRAGNKIAKLFK